MPEGAAAGGAAAGGAENSVLYIRGKTDSIGSRTDLEDMRRELRQVRSKRVRPMTDTKVITAWNGQMIDAFAYAGLVTDNAQYLDAAARAADFILDRLRDDKGGLRRIFREGETRRDAFQEDYAYLVRGLLRLFEATADRRWLVEAESLVSRMDVLFVDPAVGGYYFTSGEEELIVRTRSPYDGARASGNAMAAHALLSLARHTGETRYGEQASRLFHAYATLMKENPGRFPSMIMALRNHLYGERLFNRNRADDDGRDATLNMFINEAVNGSTATRTEAESIDNAKVEARLEVAASGRSTFDATVYIIIEDDWHINANPASLPGLIPTAVTFNADVPIKVDGLTYPPGETMRFAFVDDPLEVYQGEVQLSARIGVAPAALTNDTRLYATVYYQACNDAVCLEPGEVAMSAPLGR